ncbi:alpha/beta fold hydrolase [Nakamurella aerolata]|uniref:S9 family peptidase n=1 Tax=Nakamurella aerolata TaxID=1656892 RepID=A0A849AAK7_9ACTN|nr:alpha/beta fold hydrolase [Nakamurella aerolata]NNG37565.1 S9 family peptidase [Nakamurella aerolata]
MAAAEDSTAPDTTAATDPVATDPAATDSAAPDSAAPDSTGSAGLSFPRLSARTQRFTLGEPRNVQVAGTGERVLFVRTASGTDRTGVLWSFECDSGAERVLADPAALLTGGEQLSAAERARRERSRESGAGVTSYQLDNAGTVAVFALSGSAWSCDLATGEVTELPRPAGVDAVMDPRVDPTGSRVGYLAGGSLRVAELAGGADRALAEPDADTITWGAAEFVAAEEMDRHHGFWWSPDGQRLLAQRTDEAPVPVWQLADPADPSATPVPHRYPVAGSTDAEVTLWLLDLDGRRTQVAWDTAAYPYLTRVSWTDAGAVIQLLSRDQRRGLIGRIDPDSGALSTLTELSDDVWIELAPGVPQLTDRGLLTLLDDAASDTRRLALDGRPLSPVGLQVRAVVRAGDDGILVRGNGSDPSAIGVYRIGWDTSAQQLTPESGVHAVSVGGDTVATSSADLDSDGITVSISRGGEPLGTLERRGIEAPLMPRPTLLRAGERRIPTAVLFPTGHRPGSERLPVLMAPYGGPHGQLVQQHRRMFLQAQFLADQGFCVIVADGRGTPGGGPAWEKSIRDAFAEVTLADQVAALEAVAGQYPDDIDPARVGILGWSYGGYLSALAVLDRPDVFNAAVAGAPVTEWRLYDTFYTERYLGHPGQQPQVYDANSLLPLASRPLAPGVAEPELLILHGMVDDNVVVAHTLQLSSALLAAGRRHAVIPLTGVTHMTPQEIVAENLLRLQVDFLRRALAVDA